MRLPVAVSVVLASLIVGACGGDNQTAGTTPATTATGVQGPSEVQAEPVEHAGDNPFTESVGRDRRDIKPPRQVANATRPTSYRGSVPGLYGGTMDYSSCDKRQLITFLQSDPAKAQAWSRVLNITTTDIRTFVSDLTAVTLRTDTRVTNHGFVNGVANPIQSVLQAGTAVLVDKYGRPVVKCYCGNPLLAPLTYDKPVYVGPVWTDFRPASITIINQSTTIINNFRLYDPESDVIFTRPAGTDGRADEPFYGEGGSEPPEPEPEPEPVPEPEPEPAPEPAAPAGESPSAYFDPASGTASDTYVLHVSGFAPGGRVAVRLSRPDGVQEDYSIDIGPDGSGSYTFPNDGSAPPGTYTAVITNPDTGKSTSAQTTVHG